MSYRVVRANGSVAPSFITAKQDDTNKDQFTIELDSLNDSASVASYQLKLEVQLADYASSTPKLELPFLVNITAKSFEAWTPPS